MRYRVPKVVFLVVFATAATVAMAEDKWVATWAASPQAASFGFAPSKPAAGAPKPAPAPDAAAKPAAKEVASFFAVPGPLDDQTVRQVVRVSVGGKSLRVKVSNAHGAIPLVVGAARVALRDKGSAIKPGTDHALTFGGKASFSIPPGALAVSDPVALAVEPLADLAISLFVTGEEPSPTVHLTGLHTTYVTKAGDFTKAAELSDVTTLQAWYWIAEVDVLAPADAATIVAFGDSITDGATSTPDKDQSWPSQLAVRLAANKETAHVGIVNHGISGNQLLSDGAGYSALARFDRDVLATPGVKWLVVLEGINDIGMSSMMGGEVVSADAIIGAQRQLIDRAHLHGVKVVGATLLPYGGASYHSEKGEAVRQAVNQWIRTGGAYDAVVDFDAKLRDPRNPGEMDPAYYINDHLHPNDAGYKLMADAFDLAIFK
ncbi:MAG: SGNH/GDSL hydrolase family protein [Acidobacteriota bacterium]|jgi:lysophospholipase L1-like esterase|nr:SGNH/GDSL hydrolase family protein [Acidobacteriota bacterium]